MWNWRTFMICFLSRRGFSITQFQRPIWSCADFWKGPPVGRRKAQAGPKQTSCANLRGLRTTHWSGKMFGRAPYQKSVSRTGSMVRWGGKFGPPYQISTKIAKYYQISTYILRFAVGTAGFLLSCLPSLFAFGTMGP
jgi:hypothetical protein